MSDDLTVDLEVDPADIDWKKVDDRGRISIGLPHAGKKVRVALLGVAEADDADD